MDLVKGAFKRKTMHPLSVSFITDLWSRTKMGNKRALQDV